MKYALGALLLVLAMPAAAQPGAAQNAPVDYAAPSAWLCLPGREDACSRRLETVELEPTGYGAVTTSAPAADAPIDCFYVYPTVSRDPGMNSDMSPGNEEQSAAVIQFARFSSICRPFAPLYRQATMASIGAAVRGEVNPASLFDLAYGDVVNAWRYYLAHYNNGRPFVLIGHSQGSIHLQRLISEQIEGKEIGRRLVSAVLLGWSVDVPQGGALVGGTFRSIPLCSHPGETGCVISYMSFRQGSPPGAGALMGRSTRPGMTTGCTNPAALGSQDSAVLDSYWSAVSGGQHFAWSSSGPPPAPFLHTRGLVTARCMHDGQAGYLAVTVNADPADARTDQIPGDIPLPGWGLHVIDMNLAQGDLLRAVRQQRDAYLSAAR
jgi:hypothetical protein